MTDSPALPLNAPRYFPKSWEGDQIARSNQELVDLEQALASGLAPNQLWTEDDLMKPKATRGCTIYVTDPAKHWARWNSPFHRVVTLRDFDSARLLLQSGANIDLCNSFGRTALHEAIHNQFTEVVEFLVQHNANVNAVTHEGGEYHGYSCVHMALSIGNTAIFRYLMESSSANPNTLIEGWSLIDLAFLSQSPTMLRILQSQNPEHPLPPRAACARTTTNSVESSFSEAAKSLLCTITSSRLVPSSECREVYEYIFSSLSSSRGDAMPAEDLIEAFTDRLYSIANEKRRRPKDMKLCLGCTAFWSLPLESRVDEGTGVLLRPKHRIHENKHQLDHHAAAGCPSCAWVADALDMDPDVPTNLFHRPSVPNKPETPGIFLELRTNVSNSLYSLPSLKISYLGRQSMLALEELEDVFTPETCGRDFLEDTYTGSDQALKLANEMLHLCRHRHSTCLKHRKQESELPTRVLDVGDSQKHPALVEGKGRRSPYCALSYCWGTGGNFITTRSNLARQMEGIPLERFPRSIHDAILAARALNFQYIWIDALCIVQDDEDDWNRESNDMLNVYSGADLTISSLVAQSCQDGFFTPRSRRISRPLTLELFCPKVFRRRWKEGTVRHWAVCRHASPLDKKYPFEGPVHKRGWTLQEQLLSTRILYFGAGIVHLDCLRGHATELAPGSFWRGNSDTEWMAEMRLMLNGSRTDWERPFELWQSVVTRFTRRALTNASDRGPAFMAISKRMEPVIQSQYVAGLWKGDRMLKSLCWNAQGPPPRKRLHGPSWTWFSIPTEIDFKCLRHTGTGNTRSKLSTTVISMDLDMNESQSRVRGSITLKGTLHHKRVIRRPGDGKPHAVTKEFIHYTRSESKEFFDESSDDGIDSCYALDMLSYEKGPPHEGFGMPVWPDGCPPGTVRLLLQPLNENLDEFRRIGVGVYDDISSRQNMATRKQMFSRQSLLKPPDWLFAQRKDISAGYQSAEVKETDESDADTGSERSSISIVPEYEPAHFYEDVIWSREDATVTIY